MPGVLLLMAALVILAVPEILVAMVAAFVMVIGFIALYVGHRMRQSEIEFFDPEDGPIDGRDFSRAPLYRRWSRRF